MHYIIVNDNISFIVKEKVNTKNESIFAKMNQITIGNNNNI